MRILALDLGEKRIGVAVSDALKITAQGLETYERKSPKADYAHIAEIIKDRAVTKVVLGMPRNMNGTYGPASEKVKEFAQGLGKVIDTPIQFWDERLSTVAAQRTLIDADVSRKKRKNVVDKMAAVIILQGYLDSLI